MNSNLYYQTDGFEALSGALLIGIIIFSIIIGLIVYALNAFILYKTAKTNGFDDAAYLAWIPLANLYLLLLLGADGVDLEQRRAFAIKWLWISIGALVLSLIPIIGIIFSIGVLVITVYAYYKLFYRWSAEKNQSILFSILNLIFSGIFFIIYGFLNMNKPFKA